MVSFFLEYSAVLFGSYVQMFPMSFLPSSYIEINQWHVYAGTEERRLYSSNPFETRRWKGVVSSTPGRFTPEKSQVHFAQEAGWASGPFWMGTKYLATTGFRSSDRSACNKSLYRLLSPGRHLHHTGIEWIKYFGY
jgi:hypothetical protein